MTDNADNVSATTGQNPASDSVSLILFSVGDVFFGVDADQIEAISAYQPDNAENLHWFHKEVGYGDKTVNYHSPVVVTINSEATPPYRVIIDNMEDIAEFRKSEIHLFPVLLEIFSLKKGIWAILLRHGKMVFLLDFQRLLNEKSQ